MAAPHSRTRGTVFLIIARVLSLAASLVAVPVQINLVGASGYGVSIFIMSLAALVWLVDPGYLEGAQYRLTEAHSLEDEDRSEFRQTWCDVWVITVLIGLTGALAFLGLRWLYPAPDYTGTQNWLFLAGAFWFATMAILTGLNQYLIAVRQLTELAVMNLVNSLTTVITATGLAWLTRDAAGLVFGSGLGNALAIALILLRIRQPVFIWPTAWKPWRWKRYLQIGIKSLGNRILAIASTNADRLLLAPILGQVALANLATSGRIPGALGEVSSQLQTTVRPDITLAHLKSEQDLTRAFDRYTRLAMAVAVCLVLPISSCSELLTLWLGDAKFDSGGLIMLISAWGIVMSAYLSVMGVASISVGRANLIFPAMLANAVATVGLTIPLAHQFGLPGVAMIKPGIHLLTMVPLLLYLRKTIVPSLPVARHLAQVAAILAIGAAISVGAVVLNGTPWVAQYPVLVLPVAGLLTYLALVAIHTFGLAEIPASIVRHARLGWAKRARTVASG